MESKHIVEVEEQEGPPVEIVVARHQELDRLYCSWAEARVQLYERHLNALKSTDTPNVEPKELSSIADSVTAKFESFLAAFDLQLPEIYNLLMQNQHRSMYLSVKGIDKTSLMQILATANKHKLHGILVGDQLELVTLNRIQGNEIKVEDLPDYISAEETQLDLDTSEAEVKSSGPNTNQQKRRPAFYITAGSKRITKTQVKNFKDVPEVVTDVKFVEFFPQKSAAKVRITAPTTYGDALVKYHTRLTIETRAGVKLTSEEVIDLISKDSSTKSGQKQTYDTDFILQFPSLIDAKSVALQVFAESSTGKQPYCPYLRFDFPASAATQIKMLGRNELNQIDVKVVDESARKVIEANLQNEQLEGFCDSWAQVSFDSLGVEGLRPIAVSSRLTTLAIVNNFQLVQWGSSLTKQEDKYEALPASLFLRKGLLVQSVAVGGSFCAALTISSQIYTWGNNTYGQLGLGTFSEGEIQPTLVTGVLDGKRVVSICAGEDHMICLSEQGIAYTWGKKQAVTGEGVVNRFGDRIGLCNFITHQSSPQDISSAFLSKTETVTQVATGDDTLGMITSTGSLYLWGDNDDHVLGLEYPAPNSAIPIRYQLGASLRPLAVQIGLNHVGVLCQQNGGVGAPETQETTELLCWGRNEHGQCGTNLSDSITSPTAVEGLSGTHISFFSCGTERTFVITDRPETSVFVFGRKLKGLTDKDFYAPHKLSESGKAIYEGYDTVVLSG